MPNERVLVLEDHPELLRQMCDILNDAGYQTQAAATSADALALARQTTFDLLIADVYVPDGSGVETFRRIRAMRSDIAGIAVTGQSTWELALEALRIGFVGFLVKPIVPEQLIASVVSALEQEKLRHENTRLRALVPLYELSRAFMGAAELPDLLNQIVNTVRQETHAEVVSLMLFGDDRNELHIAAAGLPGNIVATQKRMLGRGIAGRVAQTGEPLMLADGLPLDPEIRKAMIKPELLSALSVPLKLRGQVIGVLNLSRTKGNEPFTHSDLELTTVFAGQAAIAIDKTRLINELRQLSDISQRLARTVDLDEACTVILSAPIELINARGTALWLTDDSAAVRTLGLEDVQVPQIELGNLTEEFRADHQAGWLTLPIRYGDKPLGALMVRLNSPNTPNDERLGTLRTISHVAGTVIESHRLRSREAQAFRQVDRAVRADLNLQDLLERLLGEMIETCQAEGGVIFLWNNERTQLEPWVVRGLDVPSSAVQKVLAAGTACRFSDLASERYLLGALMATGKRIEGVAVLARSLTAGEFRGQQTELLSTLSSAAALVVRNAQLYARSEEAAIAEERTRIAREIHDGLAQNLSYLVLKIGVVQKLALQNKDRELRKELNDISDQLRHDARDVRRIIFALRPVDIETEGFLPALEKYAKEFGAANDIAIEFNQRGDFEHLSPKLETALFRLTQEALNNIRKHARAKRVKIELSIDEHRVAILRVRDDGVGFDIEPALQAARARGSVGLVQMRERAERAGGNFSIESARGKGTTILVRLPIREA